MFIYRIVKKNNPLQLVRIFFEFWFFMNGGCDTGVQVHNLLRTENTMYFGMKRNAWTPAIIPLQVLYIVNVLIRYKICALIWSNTFPSMWLTTILKHWLKQRFQKFEATKMK